MADFPSVYDHTSPHYSLEPIIQIALLNDQCTDHSQESSACSVGANFHLLETPAGVQEDDEALDKVIMGQAKREVALHQDTRYQDAYDALIGLYNKYNLPLPDKF